MFLREPVPEIEKHLMTIVLIGLSSALVTYYLLTKEENRYPPGPWCFPIIGNFPQLIISGSVTRFAEKYRKIYGDVSHVVLC